MLTARDPVLLLEQPAAAARIDELAASGYAICSLTLRTELAGSLRRARPIWMSPWHVSVTWLDYCLAVAAEAKGHVASWPAASRVEVSARAGSEHVSKARGIVEELFSGASILVAEDKKELPLVAARLTRSTRTFSAGQLVYVFDVYWGMNERVKAVGRYRRKHRFVVGACPIAILDDCRPKRVMTPAVIELLTGERIPRALFEGRFWPMPVSDDA